EPPTQVAVKALGTVDVRNRDDDDLKLYVDASRPRRFDCSFAACQSIAHVGLLWVSALREWFAADRVKCPGPMAAKRGGRPPRPCHVDCRSSLNAVRSS